MHSQPVHQIEARPGFTHLGNSVFYGCHSLANLTIPSSITSIGNSTFSYCYSLTGVFFQGDLPTIGSTPFVSTPATIYYLPGTMNWSTTFGGRPTVLWNPQAETSDPSFGVQAGQFGFPIKGTTNIPIVVEACTNIWNGKWEALQSCTITNGNIYFVDSNWTNYPSRFYRIRSP
jgi:hypothetical protein